MRASSIRVMEMRGGGRTVPIQSERIFMHSTCVIEKVMPRDLTVLDCFAAKLKSFEEYKVVGDGFEGWILKMVEGLTKYFFFFNLEIFIRF